MQKELFEKYYRVLGILLLVLAPINGWAAYALYPKGHLSYALSGYRGKRRFAIYVPDELAPEVQKAIENGRQLQELMKEAGLRYVKARKQERRLREKK